MIHKPKITFTATSGKLDFYLEDYARNLALHGNKVDFVPLAHFNNKPFYRFWENREEFKYRRLEETLTASKSDILICNFSTLRFDFARIRSFFKGKIVLYDMEGPNFKAYREPSKLKEVDLIITVSRVMAEKLHQLSGNAVYLPHGVECSRFRRVSIPPREDKLFRRKAIFIGRPSPHRVELLQALSREQEGLTLYGRHWANQKELFHAASPYGKDITGEALLKAVSGAEFAVNILQDQFLELRTLMNLQLFFYAAMGCPLLTEFVQEVPECFEEDKEMCFFRDPEEFLAKAKWMASSPDLPRMGGLARERVLKEHTLYHRAGKFHQYLQEL